MFHLIPKVKELEIRDGYLKKRGIYWKDNLDDHRISNAVRKLPQDEDGVELRIDVWDNKGEAYELWVQEDLIQIKANGMAGAFYAIQTLRQIFKHEQIPCVYINDKPDFPYRGFYHDVTRGKVPTVETLKKLIDEMAYYKLNSLQLYVEHTFEFKEYKGLNDAMGYMSAEEMQELDTYCYENFIDFIPSLSTFGHLYELLEQEQYQHLRVLKDFEKKPNFWHSRMLHHTIDPTNPESIELIKSLIDQYVPHFQSGYFNICCDETFDLTVFDDMGYDSGRLYVDFVKQIISHVQSKGKKVMMWADILLKHPETIDELPEDIYFLNWNYRKNPPEDKIIQFAEKERKQLVCPGTTTWNRLCENVDVEEQNISLMTEYGYEHGALGVLNTNWGDWGNPCSIELAMYGLVLGAEKSWSVSTEINEEFYEAVNTLLYENETGIQRLKELSEMHELVQWTNMCRMSFKEEYVHESSCEEVQKAYLQFVAQCSKAWKQDEYRQEMILAAEGICVMAELLAKAKGEEIERITDTKEWLRRYSAKWIEKNKKSELNKIEEMFMASEKIKVVLWDIDGTLLNFEEAEKAAIRKGFELFGLGQCTDEMLQVYSTINKKYWKRLERGEISKPEVLEGRFREFFEKYGIDTKVAAPFNAEYQINLGDTICFYPNALETIKECKGKVLQYAVTNGTKIAQDRKLKNSGLIDLFDGVFISDVIGAEKPSVKFFETVFESIGSYDKTEVLIVGDSLTSDIQGGNNADILTCWFNPEKIKNEMQLRIDYQIEDLAQILDIIK